MEDEIEMMSAEELFGEPEGSKGPGLRPAKSQRKSGKDFFAESKIKMVMRIYGVSRVRAKEIIDGRAHEKAAWAAASESRKAARRRLDDSDDETLMSAEEFFGG